MTHLGYRMERHVAHMAAVRAIQRSHQLQRVERVLAQHVAWQRAGLQMEGDAATIALLAPLNHQPTATAVAAERAFLAVLDGSCRTPIAGLATIEGGEIAFRGLIVRPDGSEHHRTARRGPASQAAALGRDAGEELRALAGADFFVDNA